ncbi:MAG TPA: efflux transporter outer membrane subunit [Novosphingobium sp.]|nr:efflux transporter outer membrane subunit [Novosphingobium sp.]
MKSAACRAKLALGAACLVALAGCKAVGPDYHLPQKAAINLPAAQGAFLGAAPAGADAKPLPPRWWHLFDAPVLDRLEEQALAANTDLRVAAANLKRAQEATGMAESAHEPDFTASFAGERARLSGESFLLSEPVPVMNVGSGQIAVGYQLDLFGRIRRAVEEARASEQAVAAVQDAVKASIAADVARSYVMACAAGEDIALTDEAIAVEKRRLDVDERLQAGGRLTPLELAASRARLAQVEAVRPAHVARQRAALFRLAYLLGKPPAEYPREVESCEEIPSASGIMPVGDGASLLARRPDVRASERELAAATAQIGVATAAMYPDIRLGAALGSFGKLGDFGTAPANFWNAGGMIDWAFPTHGARARVRAANAGADAALARFDGVVLAALRETETALSTYAQDLNRQHALAEALHQNELATADIERLRRAGRSPLSAHLGAEQGTISAKAAVSEGKARLANDQVDLFLALGGGW